MIVVYRTIVDGLDDERTIWPTLEVAKDAAPLVRAIYRETWEFAYNAEPEAFAVWNFDVGAYYDCPLFGKIFLNEEDAKASAEVWLSDRWSIIGMRRLYNTKVE